MPLLCNTPTAHFWKLQPEHKGVREKKPKQKTEATTYKAEFASLVKSNNQILNVDATAGCRSILSRALSRMHQHAGSCDQRRGNCQSPGPRVVT